MRALYQAINALTRTMEFRDPYTCGHQQNVARLARCIAQDLGLESHRIEGLRLAATTHDVGKIAAPIEILARPGPLNRHEIAIVSAHSQVGHDILAEIDFPWPVAKMVLQHHERMDGSGYPNGLSGNAILLEARILAVADTVEAMCAHRPYRPAYGIDAALDTIAEGRGRTFDSAVVDACIRLFAEKRFTFLTMGPNVVMARLNPEIATAALAGAD